MDKKTRKLPITILPVKVITDVEGEVGEIVASIPEDRGNNEQEEDR